MNNDYKNVFDDCWIRTWTNKHFNYDSFTEDDIDIRDIAQVVAAYENPTKSKEIG